MGLEKIKNRNTEFLVDVCTRTLKNVKNGRSTFI